MNNISPGMNSAAASDFWSDGFGKQEKQTIIDYFLKKIAHHPT